MRETDEVVAEVARYIGRKRADAHVYGESAIWPSSVGCSVHIEGLVRESLACKGEGFAWGFGGAVEFDAAVFDRFDREDECVDFIPEFAKELEQRTVNLRVCRC